MIKHERKSSLKLLSKLPCLMHADGGVMQDVADEVETRDLAGDSCRVHQQRGNDRVRNLEHSISECATREA